MKIWIDILTPKQVNFFAPLVRRLSKRGTDVLVTTREYREVNQLLKIRKIDALEVGRHGGRDLRTKLISSAERIRSLASLLPRHGCERAISFSSPEAARVAYGLSIPHYCVSDSPHAEAVSRLTIPLSKVLFTPKAIPLNAWRNYGIERAQIIRYNALDPVAWLRDLKPDPSVLDALGLDRSKPIITVRPEESQASYLIGKTSGRWLSVSLARALARELPPSQVVLLPRYDMASLTKKMAGRSVTVPDSAIDATSLLYYSRLFLGGGGTMTTEAALLGVPSISFYPNSPTIIESYLVKLGFVVRMVDVQSIVKRALHILRNPDYEKAAKIKSKNIISRMEDPIAVIEKHLR